MTAHGPRVGDRSIVWHRGIDDAEIPSLLVTRNLVCVARIFSSGKWTVTITLGTRSTFETGSWKNLELAKQKAENSMVRCTAVLAQQLLDWTAKHRRGDAPKKKTKGDNEP